MNKSKIILCAVGGVFAIAVGVLGFFAYDAFSSKNAALVEGDDEGHAGLDSVVRQIASLSAKSPYPSRENAARIAGNKQAVGGWVRAVRDVAARGDWCPDASCTPAQFKEQIGREAKLFLARTNTTGEAFLPPEFAFGSFREYLGEKMPARDRLARLQRQWHDMSSLLTLLSTNGVLKVTDLQVVEQAAAADDEKAKGRPKARAKAKDGGAKPPAIETYKLSFLALPSVFVQVVRDLSFRERFTVVDDFVFTRERDAVFEALGGDKKKESASKRKGKSRWAKEQEETPEDEKTKGMVFDPAKDSTLKVEMTVSVYDFRSLEDDEKEVAK